MDVSSQQIVQAYARSGLSREGISLDAALATPMFKTCLTRIAEARIVRINQPSTTKPQWWNQGSMA